MLRYILKPLFFHKPNHCAFTNFRFLQTQSASTKTKTKVACKEKQSPTVSYLRNSCGLSLESAISASRLVKIKNKERSDSVLDLLRSHGFSQNDISKLISKRPRIILANPDNNLRPRLEFIESLGISRPDLPATFIKCTRMLDRSLNDGIKPALDFLKSYADTDENVARTLRVLNNLISVKLEKVLLNVETLRNYDMPKTQIGKIVWDYPNSVAWRPDLFKEVVADVSKMGIDPECRKFISAVVAMTMMNKATWDRKKEILSSLGWTDSDFDLGFSLQPMFMFTSVKKMREMMDFLVNKIGLKASDVARCPNVFLISLEKRVIPRWSVLQILMSKGLLEKDSNLIWKFNVSKKMFEISIVHKFMDKIPELVKAYENPVPQKIANNAYENPSSRENCKASIDVNTRVY